MAKHFTLGKNERLKSRKQIERLFKNGQRFVSPPFRVFYSFENAQQSNILTSSVAACFLQAGFGASSRIFKKAIDRNRIKRLAREAYRLQKNTLQDKLKEQNRKLNVFFIYTGKELPMYSDVYNSINKALTKLLEIGNKKI
ncbi:MAG TPA: ribonuclease P protein component [Chitinophagaceae bacterium]|nr:ribonuclease P protein component [Chitinophagaceae bacterium]